MVLRFQWRDLDAILRLSTILGLAGCWWIFYFAYPIGQFLLSLNISAIVQLSPLLIIALFPIVSFASALGLLLRPMSEEKRGILGLVCIVGGIVPTFFLALFLWSLVFPSGLF